VATPARDRGASGISDNGETPGRHGPAGQGTVGIVGFQNRTDDEAERDWLLQCEGMGVEAPDGFVGRVVEPLYRPSARWDRPWALAVRGAHGVVTVPIEAVISVDRTADRIRLGRPTDDLRPS